MKALLSFVLLDFIVIEIPNTLEYPERNYK